MFCCLSLSRRAHVEPPNDEKRPLLTSPVTTAARINYQTIFAIPYAHVLRDDKIQIEPVNVSSTPTGDAYLLFNGTIANPAYNAACFSFDDTDVSSPVMFATTTSDPQFLFERLFSIDHVSAINPSRGIRLQSVNEAKPSLASGAPAHPARPFDDFILGPNTPLDSQGNPIVPKGDND